MPTRLPKGVDTPGRIRRFAYIKNPKAEFFIYLKKKKEYEEKKLKEKTTGFKKKGSWFDLTKMFAFAVAIAYSASPTNKYHQW